MSKIHSVILNALPDKKIKSLGNKCLLKVSKNKNLISHNLDIINHISDIVDIICGFEYKKFRKYIESNFIIEKINLIYHDIDESTNIGKSIRIACQDIKNTSILFINSSIILQKNILKKLNFDSSFAVVRTKDSSDIGCIIHNNTVVNCFYGLPNKVYDILYIHDRDLDIFKNYIINTKNFDKLYMFEIINLCINYGIQIKGIDIHPIQIHSIESNKYYDKNYDRIL